MKAVADLVSAEEFLFVVVMSPSAHLKNKIFNLIGCWSLSIPN